MDKFASLIKTVLLIAVVITGHCKPSLENHQDDRFNAWVQNALEGYSTWVENNDMNPSPVLESPLNVSGSNTIVRLDCQLWNYTVKDYANGISNVRANADIDGGQMNIAFLTSFNDISTLVTFEGEYTATGIINSSIPIPISGAGRWTLTYEFMWQQVFFNNVQVTPDGYLKISNESENDFVYVPELYTWTLVDFEFEGLLEGDIGEYADHIKQMINRKFLLAIGSPRVFPAANVLFQYFDDLFQSTPLVDIIGTTPTPSATVGGN